MSTHTIQIPEESYRRLQEQAAQARITPEQVIERLLAGDRPPLMPVDDEIEPVIPPAGSAVALTALQRLTTLFADGVIPNVDEVLADPMLRLENAGVLLTDL